MTATIIEVPSLRSTPEERAAERQLVEACSAEIVHIAQRLQPDEDELDIRRAGIVWRLLRRAWHAADEPGTFTDFADAQLAVVQEEATACAC
jgi:hypothetical protein